MFKPANPNSRIPAVLQAHTKENIIFQLALTVVFIGGMTLIDVVQERRETKKRNEQHHIRMDLIG